MGAHEIVHPVPREEVPAWTRAMVTTFLSDPHGAHADRRIALMEHDWQPDRTWGARAGDRWVGTLRTEARHLTVPGAAEQSREITVDALTNVTVAATHRRRGVMREMLSRSLAAARERGDAASVLIAAEWPIYGSFGYAPAALGADYALHPRRLAGNDFGEPSRLRHVEGEELARLVPAIFSAARHGHPGQMDREGAWWPRLLGLDGYPPSEALPPNWLVHEGDDGPDGYLAWEARGDFDLSGPHGKVEVWEMAAASSQAYRDIWAYVAGVDGVDEVTLPGRPIEEPVQWLLSDGRALQMRRSIDLLWLRLLDVRAALSARAYAIAAEVVLDIRDDGGPAGGRFLLRSEADGSASCEVSSRSPDLELTQRALASIYLGGFRLAQLRMGGGVRELSPGALRRTDLMFSTPTAPWNATWF